MLIARLCQAEWHFFLVGLDIEEKCRWMEEQARHAIGEELMSKFSLLKFHVHGTSPLDPVDQEIATVDFRIFAQAKDAALFDPSLPDGFSRRLYETVLQSCPVSGISGPDAGDMDLTRSIRVYQGAMTCDNQQPKATGSTS